MVSETRRGPTRRRGGRVEGLLALTRLGVIHRLEERGFHQLNLVRVGPHQLLGWC